MSSEAAQRSAPPTPMTSCTGSSRHRCEPRLTSGTVYAVADRIDGPYEEPADHVLLASMGFNAISCRTVALNGSRYVLYTSSERELENDLKPTFGSDCAQRAPAGRRSAAAVLRGSRRDQGRRYAGRRRLPSRGGAAARCTREQGTVGDGRPRRGGCDRHGQG